MKISFKPTVISIIGTFFLFAFLFSFISQPCTPEPAFCYDENKQRIDPNEVYLGCSLSCESTLLPSILNVILKVILPLIVAYVLISIIQSKWLTPNTE